MLADSADPACQPFGATSRAALESPDAVRACIGIKVPGGWDAAHPFRHRLPRCNFAPSGGEIPRAGCGARARCLCASC
jgi:hypothetical protein